MSEHSREAIRGDASQQAEFSRIIRVDRLVDQVDDVSVGDGDGQGESFSFTADEDERRALAKRFDLLSLDSLEASVEAQRFVSKGQMRKAVRGVRLRVQFTADVIQSCVVTLDPVAAHIAQGFEVDYLPQGAKQFDAGFGGGEVVVDIDEVDPPEVLEGKEIDIGVAIAEHLSLALDLYPRAAKAEIDADQAVSLRAGDNETGDNGAGDDDKDLAANHPFAALKKLKTQN